MKFDRRTVRVAGRAHLARHRGMYTLVADYNSVDGHRRFVADLARRGWSERRLEKLRGGNFLRLHREAWGG